MQLIINGETRTFEDVSTIADLLVALKLDKKILVVEKNREIVDRFSYVDARLQNQDRLEIVHFVGGG